MVNDHKKTVGEFQREAGRGADPEIKAFAAAQLPALQEHLRMAQRLNDRVTMRRGGGMSDGDMNSNGGGGNMNSNSNPNGNMNSNSNNSNR